MGRKRKISDENIDNEDKAGVIAGEIHNNNVVEVQEKQEVQEVQEIIEEPEIIPVPIAESEKEIKIEEIKPITFASDEELAKMLKGHEDENPEIKDVKAETPAAEEEKKASEGGAVGVDISMFLTPRLLIVIYDKIYPNVLAYVAKNFLKLEINNDLNLSDDEIELLEPIVAEMIKGVSMKMNPFAAFFICSNFFYISKLMEAPRSNEYTNKQSAPKPKKKRGRPRKVVISNNY